MGAAGTTNACGSSRGRRRIQALLEEDTFELVVQVNGKVRDRLVVPADLPEEELVARAKESPKVQAQLNGGEIRQTIVVPRKLVNLVIG